MLCGNTVKFSLHNGLLMFSFYTQCQVMAVLASFLRHSRLIVAEVVPSWSTHVGNNLVLEDDVVFLHKQEELAVARGLGQKPVAQVSYCIALP